MNNLKPQMGTTPFARAKVPPNYRFRNEKLNFNIFLLFLQ